MSAITLGRINSKVFYVIEFAEIPIGNESYRSIMVMTRLRCFNILLFWKWKCRKKKWLKGVLISTSAKDLFFGRNHIFSLHTDPGMIIYPCYLWHTEI